MRIMNSCFSEAGITPFDVLRESGVLATCKYITSSSSPVISDKVAGKRVGFQKLLTGAAQASADDQLHCLALFARHGSTPGVRRFGLRALSHLQDQGYIELRNPGRIALPKPRVYRDMQTLCAAHATAVADPHVPDSHEAQEQLVETLMDCLTPRQRLVVRYRLDGMTFIHIGGKDEIKLSLERTRPIYLRAISKMRDYAGVKKQRTTVRNNPTPPVPAAMQPTVTETHRDEPSSMIQATSSRPFLSRFIDWVLSFLSSK